MHRQGFDLQLTQYDDRGWRATFYTTGMEHSPTSAHSFDLILFDAEREMAAVIVFFVSQHVTNSQWRTRNFKSHST